MISFKLSGHDAAYHTPALPSSAPPRPSPLLSLLPFAPFSPPSSPPPAHLAPVQVQQYKAGHHGIAKGAVRPGCGAGVDLQAAAALGHLCAGMEVRCVGSMYGGGGAWRGGGEV